MVIIKKKNLVLMSVILVLTICCFTCSKSNTEENLVKDVVEEEEITVVEESSPIINEADFYTTPTNYAVTKNLVTDYGADTVFNTDDSAVLRYAIDDISTSGGGKLIIPEGNYSFAEITLQSNVHIEIDSKAIIRPAERLNNRNYAIFKIINESSNSPVENVSISGVNGSFTVDLRNTSFINLRVIQVWNSQNFKLSNMLVEDAYTAFSSIEFNGVKIGDSIYGPKYGIVKNIKVNNADYGYGLVQLQLGSNIYFNNIDGIGGTTLRIETHNTVLREIGTYEPSTKIFGRKIRSEKGNSALMLSPHFINNGMVDIRDITSFGSGFAVRVENGFTTSEEASLGLVAGSFHPESIIRNVTATYASSGAQLKPKHYKYMPCSLRHLIETTPIPPNNVSFYGPSIAGLQNISNYKVDVSENDVTGIGFIDGHNFVDDSDAIAIGNCN